MSKLSQNFSNLVFKQNIPLKLEQYVFNCEMLEILFEIDGKRTVSAIAGALNKPVDDLITALANLYRQNLILAVAFSPSTTIRPLFEARLKDRSQLLIIEDKKRLTAIRDSSDFNKKSTESNIMETHGPHHETGKTESESPYSDLSDILSPMPSHFLTSALPSTDKETSWVDIFSTNQIKHSKSRNSSYAGHFEENKTTPPGKKSDTRFTDDKKISSSADMAAEYFEKGVSFLHRREFKKALSQFECSLKIDPKNRLCRANIQRIQKLLKEMNEPLKVFR